MNQHVPVDPSAPLSQAVAAGKAAREADAKTAEFERELASLLNRHSQENRSGTPDFILANYLTGCLKTYAEAIEAREKWYGREQDDRFGTPKGGF
ncbi:MAG: hypothetical protein ACSLE6_07430 [Mycobacterium sp.]